MLRALMQVSPKVQSGISVEDLTQMTTSKKKRKTTTHALLIATMSLQRDHQGYLGEQWREAFEEGPSSH